MFSYNKKHSSKKPELPSQTKARKEAEEAQRFALLSPQEQEEILKQKAIATDIKQIKKDVLELPDMDLEDMQTNGKDLARQLSDLAGTKVYFAQSSGTSNAAISSETFIYSNKNEVVCNFFERAQQTASAMGLKNQLIISYNRDNQARNGCTAELSRNDGKLVFAILNHLLKSLTMKLTQENSNINSENNNNQSMTLKPGR